jgi:small-conductance mechanosensitive channel
MMDELFVWLAKLFGHIPLEGVEALLFKSIKAGIVFLGLYVISHLLQKWIEKRLKKSADSSDQVIQTYQKVIRILRLIAGLFVILYVMGFDLTHLFTTSGLLAVAIGLALKDVLGNYFSGVILKANDFIKHGDILQVDGRIVRVKSIGARVTLVRNKDGLDILIPNSVLSESKIGNYTLKDSLCRLHTSIGVSYSSDLKQVRQVLEDTCDRLEGLSDKMPPQVYLHEFGNSAVTFLVYVSFEDPWSNRVMQSKLNEAIWWALKDAGIVIAFPQLDVHFDKDRAELTNDGPSQG